MKVLVTGGQGRIGRALIAELRRQGYWVRSVDFKPHQDSRADERIQLNLQDADAVHEVCGGIDVVVHLAALMSWQPKDEHALYNTNVTATFNLLTSALRSGVRRFVFASSGEVYPELNPQYLPIDEVHPTEPTSMYGLSKLLGELMVKRFGKLGLPYCILRFSHVQVAEELLDPFSFFSGPRFYVNAKLKQLSTLPNSGEVAQSISALNAVAQPAEQLYIACDPDGRPYRMTLCDVRDIVQGVICGVSASQAVGEVFNIGPEKSFSFDEAVLHLSQVTGLNYHKVQLFTTPYHYETSVDKAKKLLNYRPKWSITSMIDDAMSTTLSRVKSTGEP